jgi:hypothetical protein
MSASTLPKRGPEMTLALEIAEAGATDPRKAVAMATRAARRFPNFLIPAGGDREVTFAQMKEHFEALVAAAPVVAVQESAPPAARKSTTSKSTTSKSTTSKSTTARRTAPVKAAPVKAAPTVEPARTTVTVLQLVHDGVSQTAIFGVPKGSPAVQAIGSAKRGGLGWWFFRDNLSFYLPGSQGYAPDMAKIGEAVTRLESLTGESGEQLYRVEQSIMSTVDGKALPVRKTRDEMREWQRAYTAAHNRFGWEISMSTAECGTCGAQDLGEKTARIAKGADGMPSVECATCGGFAEPVVRIPLTIAKGADGMPPVECACGGFAEPVVRIPLTLALPAAPAPVSVEQQEKAECPLCKSMQLVKNGKLALHTFNGGACRGKLGVAVVDVEPEAAQTPVRARKSAPKAAPVTEPVAQTGLVVKIQIQRALSKSKQGDVATWMRQAIAKRITNGHRGMDVELRRDKNTGVATITVIEAAGYVGDLDKAIMAAVSSVAGFGNRINK